MARSYRDIAAAELARWRRDGTAHCVLDVRGADEVELAHLTGSLHVPMERLVERIAEIPRDRPLVVMCHHGARSAFVAGFLAARGFNDVYNLDGGINAYAHDVDPSVGSY